MTTTLNLNRYPSQVRSLRLRSIVSIAVFSLMFLLSDFALAEEVTFDLASDAAIAVPGHLRKKGLDETKIAQVQAQLECKARKCGASPCNEWVDENHKLRLHTGFLRLRDGRTQLIRGGETPHLVFSHIKCRSAQKGQGPDIGTRSDSHFEEAKASASDKCESMKKAKDDLEKLRTVDPEMTDEDEKTILALIEENLKIFSPSACEKDVLISPY